MLSVCIHRSRNTLNGSRPNAMVARGLAHAIAFREGLLNSTFGNRIDFGPSKLLAFLLGSPQARVDTGNDHASFKFGECTANLEHELAHRRRGVDILLIDEQI